MRNRKQKLTSRDQMILSLLGEYGCISAARLKKRFWKPSDKTRNHFRRIGILKRHRFIENVRGDGGVTIGYRLTKKGKRFLTLGQGKKAEAIIRKSYGTQFEHDQLLIDIRQTLEASDVISNFKTEAEVRRELLGGPNKVINWETASTTPDATFSLSTPSKQMQVALELELTAKVKRRYSRIFRSHLLSQNWKLVIYIVKDPRFQKRLMETLEDIKAKDVQVRLAKTINGIYFCSLEKFQEMQLKTPLTNGRREISFEQIAQELAAQRHDRGLEIQGQAEGTSA